MHFGRRANSQGGEEKKSIRTLYKMGCRQPTLLTSTNTLKLRVSYFSRDEVSVYTHHRAQYLLPPLWHSREHKKNELNYTETSNWQKLHKIWRSNQTTGLFLFGRHANHLRSVLPCSEKHGQVNITFELI